MADQNPGQRYTTQEEKKQGDRPGQTGKSVRPGEKTDRGGSPTDKGHESQQKSDRG
jgi:hypothetical protein